MKRLLAVLVLVLFAVPLFSADVVIQWDPKPALEVWDQVRIYECNDSVCSTPTLRTSVAGTATQATVSGVNPGVHIYMARSVNSMWGESINSNQASTSPGNNPPGNVRVTVTVTVNP